MDLWTFGGVDASVASTWFCLRHARLKVVVLQPSVVSSLGYFVFGFGCFVFEVLELRFRNLGASCIGLRFRNYQSPTLSRANCMTV